MFDSSMLVGVFFFRLAFETYSMSDRGRRDLLAGPFAYTRIVCNATQTA